MGAFCAGLVALSMMPQGSVSVSQDKPVASVGSIVGRVTRPGTTDGVADVQIVLQGPTPSLEAWMNGLYSPKPELTPSMREEILRMVEGAPPDYRLEFVLNDVLFLEARLLGLPIPQSVPPVRAPGLLSAVPQRSATSEADGRFTFSDLPPGRYKVRAQREGYFGPLPSATAALGRPWDEAVVTVTEREPTTLAFRLTAGGVIGGRLRDPRGRPLVNYPVTAYLTTYREGRAVLTSLRTMDTDDQGAYRLLWLPPGPYLVAAADRPSTAQRGTGGGPGAAGGLGAERQILGPPSRNAFVRTFHSGDRDPRLTPPIMVGEGAVLAGVDIQMRADAILKVSGRIVNPFIDAKGQPTTSAARIYLATRNPGALDNQGYEERIKEFQNMALTKTDGAFEIQNVSPGAYELWVSAPDGKGSDAWGRARIDLSDRDLDNVAIAIKPNVEIRARVTVDGASPAAAVVGPMSVNVVSRDLPGSVNRPMFFTKEDVFKVQTAPEGRYRLSTSPLQGNAYVEDIRQGGVSIYDDGLDAAGASVDVEVIVRTNGATVQGTVTDNAGRPVDSALVALLPPQSRRGNRALYKSTTAKDGGKFVFKGVPPGEYKVFAWETVPQDAWMNIDFMAEFELRGKTINATAGAPTGADVTVISRTRAN